VVEVYDSISDAWGTVTVYRWNFKEKGGEKTIWSKLGDTESNQFNQEPNIAQLSSFESWASNNAATTVRVSAERNISQLGR
jgi:hypothetical protein